MITLALAENGPVIIEPKIFKDDRGYFFESFNEREFKEKVSDVDFVQDNESRSAYGTVRGLHFQKGEHAQAKLVRVVRGAVVDVVVDIRPVIDQQLQTQRAIGGDCSHVQRREALVVRLVDIGSCIHQLDSHSILAQVAGDVQSCVSKSVGLINLDFQG